MDNEKERCLITEKSEAAIREFFPERLSETRFEQPSGEVKFLDHQDFFGAIAGLAMKLATDKRNSITDRIAALEVARKAGRDQTGLSELSDPI